ncbi:bcl-2-like protein 12 isoform X1 [Ambystoma mexicanum]|uniref:bcl-2-like protein 12 isoform X1 n=1 Tax=Ambystoma mexicanum TaxID=8296 RepID=UPI0037E70F41
MLCSLYDSILGDMTVRDAIARTIKNLFTENPNEDTSPANTWDAMKAVLRGELITQGTAFHKQKKATRDALEADVCAAEAIHKRKGWSPKSYKALQMARKRLEALHADTTANLLARTKQWYYVHNNKANKLLVSNLAREETWRSILGLRDPQGSVHYADQEKIRLAAAINPRPDEVEEAIKSFKPRAPGPNGFTTRFYKHFCPQLVAPLARLLNSFAATRTITPSMQESITVLTLKPGKDPLLNLDANIYSKILANRLAPVLPNIIDPDQTGFISHRSTKDNIRGALNLIEVATQNSQQLALLALDATKAFDKVDWPFLTLTLEALSFGPTFRKMVLANYQAPKTWLRVNGRLSDPILLTCGTSQGCPLSLLLFALAMEPLAQRVWANKQISVPKMGVTQHKIALYADDVLLTVTNIQFSLRAALAELRSFEVAGFAINFSKSIALGVGLRLPSRLDPPSSHPEASTENY